MVIKINDKAEILAEELEWALSSLQRTCDNLDEEEFKFKPTTVSNSIQWQLNHISRIVNTSLPRLIKGVAEYNPEGWPEDYRNQDYPLDRLMKDIKKGADKALPMLKELSNNDLEAEIPMWGGTRQRKIGLFAYIGEVYHHKGQAAYIRGTFKRLNE
jgi:uncharacterized damage-inducible protein DinB